ncbi:MAG: hypothetical protein ACSNEK_02525 [Parachlamydiaceae bacterium]
MSIGLSYLGKRKDKEGAPLRVLASECCYRKPKRWSDRDDQVIKDWLLQGKSAEWMRKHAEFEEERSEAAIATRVAKLRSKINPEGSRNQRRWTTEELDTMKKVMREHPSAPLQKVKKLILAKQIFKESAHQVIEIERKIEQLYRWTSAKNEPGPSVGNSQAWPWPEEEKSLILTLLRLNASFAELRDLIESDQILSNWECPKIEKLIKVFQLMQEEKKETFSAL